MMGESASAPVHAPVPGRVQFVDLLRGWAVIVMIETHVFNATLDGNTLASTSFQYLKFVNGLVAPSFLFASGFAYAITTRRRLQDYLSFGPQLFRQIGRLLLVLFIGYCLHLPKFSFSKLVYETTEAEWSVFYQSDVLQCIAVSLLFLQGLLLLLRNERRMYSTLAAVCVQVVLATPLMWGIDFRESVPAIIAEYLNGLHNSLFPLFPWSAFILIGAVTGYHYLNARGSGVAASQAGGERAMMRIAAFGAIGAIALSFAIDPVAANVYPTYDYWRFSPSFVLLRIGLVILLLVAMYFYEQRVGVSRSSVVSLVGRESLLVYATHLLLIFGDFGTFNFGNSVNHTFGYMEAGGVTVVLLILMYGLAVAWSRIKHGSPRWKLAVNLSALGIFLAVFFFGPGE
jgi:uncharacterized membrane protein